MSIDEEDEEDDEVTWRLTDNSSSYNDDNVDNVYFEDDSEDDWSVIFRYADSSSDNCDGEEIKNGSEREMVEDGKMSVNRQNGNDDDGDDKKGEEGGEEKKKKQGEGDDDKWMAYRELLSDKVLQEYSILEKVGEGKKEG